MSRTLGLEAALSEELMATRRRGKRSMGAL
jgi:hypothetical protein